MEYIDTGFLEGSSTVQSSINGLATGLELDEYRFFAFPMGDLWRNCPWLSCHNVCDESAKTKRIGYHG